MLRKSSFIAPIICVSLFLLPPVITLLLVVRQISNSAESFRGVPATLPTVRRESNHRRPAGE